MTIIGNTNKTIVLVHGAWHGAWCWAATQAELDRRGLHSLAIDRPGHGASTLPLSDMYGDAALVRALVQSIPGEVVLVGHSYAGTVITEAAMGCTNISHLVYLTAFCVDAGESRVSIRGHMPNVVTQIDGARIIHDDGTSTVDPSRAVAAFYGCCDPLAAQAAAARLGPQSTISFSQPVTEASWRQIPSTYVICDRDDTIHPSHQEYMSQHCATVVHLDTDHSPFLSMPKETADILEGLARTHT
jgi:pimeloyl-ACP methyl ester carboxylesterase